MSMDAQNIWNLVLKKIEDQIPKSSFHAWIEPLRCLKLAEDILEVGVPNRFFYEFLDTHYNKTILSALSDISDGKIRIQYKIIKEDPVETQPEPVVESRQLKTKEINFYERTQLNPRYTYENFVEGDSNSFAKATALAVAEAPGKTPFNPLFIYGATGLGKTHLIQAIGNFSLAHNKTSNILYVTSEKFMNDFILAIKRYKTTDFSRLYRTVDLLLLDDIQFFQGKERTQMEFFHTFNSLYQAGAQIVLSSDRPPKEFDDFDKRLISRIGWGLVTDIQPPDFETRLAILQKRADQEGIDIPADVGDFLAQTFKVNIRDLEGALIRLLAYGSIAGKDLSLELAKDVLRDHIVIPSAVIDIETIQKKVADFYNIPADLLIARNRKKEVAHARQVAMFLCADLTNSSLQSIGLRFGNRDHSTVIHARNLISKRLNGDSKLSSEIQSLKSKIPSP
ncbi:chromosomal replication initiation protein DnaA [candidate division LCP-89 bacterium B3_LCP]|uniref:Chromosomal replication initiator protein DnaA n=1 Tax=candidate division LCP-89 bacterium B3_LCP TaxID=2012998 RepID=A0A532V4Q1_UNCL8|nr:MAG: chromosomal replication initiation protein DnaA [candidate division LCP-89 bacterium B3_LCP]